MYSLHPLDELSRHALGPFIDRFRLATSEK
jgi:hypothetical protein